MSQINQQSFFFSLDKICNINKPIFVDVNVRNWVEANYETLPKWLKAKENGDKNNYWAIPDANLKFAKDIKNNNIVGRYKLDLQNSNVCELFFDIESNKNPKTMKEVNDRYAGLRQATLRVVNILQRFGIPTDHINIKSSGKGYHVSCIFGNVTQNEFDEYTLTLLYCINLPNSKSSQALGKRWLFGLDTQVTLKRSKIREYGAANEKLNVYHYCSAVTLDQLMSSDKYPFNFDPEKVVYPEVKIYTPTDNFKQKIGLYKIQTHKTQYVQRTESPVNYNNPGNPNDLAKCPLIKSLIESSIKNHHLLHNERVFLSQLYVFFGERGEKALHDIIRNCGDYDEGYTQMQIEWVKRHGRKPITCAWAHKTLNCPPCKGSGGRSPIKFAYKTTEGKL